MSRYIDADKLKDIKFNSISNDKYGIYRMGWNDAIDAVVDNEQTADVVEVVRCKDCKYATYDKSIDRYDCRNWGSDGDEYTEADDYCSYGERADT